MFNTAIAAVMELSNSISKFIDRHDIDDEQNLALINEALKVVVLLLAPITPHLCHVLWRHLGHSEAIIDSTWPQYEESALQRSTIQIVVQVNGKLRTRIEVPHDLEKSAIETSDIENLVVKRYINGKDIRKVIVVPGRLVNIVVGD